MESLKDFLTPKSFNKISFVVIIFWILLGATLLGIFADTESYEPRFDFNCGVKTNNLKDLIEGRCNLRSGSIFVSLGGTFGWDGRNAK